MIITNLCARRLLQSAVVAGGRAHLTHSALVRSAAKTPIQEWGWQYLVRQKALKRPISPHLSVYKPQLTWMVSGAHRITGCVMAGAAVVVVGTLLVAPFDFVDFINTVKGWNMPRIIPGTLKFIIAFFISFHTVNGIRFIGMDMAKGVSSIGSIYRTGYGVLAVSVVLATYFALIMNSTLPVGQPIEQKKLK